MSKLVIKGKNIDVTTALKDFISKKMAKLDKYSQHIIEIVVEMHVEKNPRISDNQIVIVNVFVNGAVLRAEEARSDMYAAIDLVIDKLERQMKKYEQKKNKKTKTGKLKVNEMIADKDNNSLEEAEEEEDYQQYLSY